MPELDDFQYESSSSSPPPEGGGGRWIWALVALVAAIGIGAAGVWWMNQPAPPAEEVPLPAAEPPPPPRELGAPAERVSLPPLAESDPFVRELVHTLSSHPQLVAWLVPDNLIDRFVASVDNIAEGRRPVAHLRMLAPRGSFQVTGAGGRQTIDSRSYERYNLIADVVGSVNAQGAAKLYTTLKPLIAEAYRQLGYPDQPFDDTLARAFRRLLDIPMPEGTVRVAVDEANYVYADPALEARSPVEKQLIRMGPRNLRIIQDKLREIAGELGMKEMS